MKFNYLICRYGEVGIKGENRRWFERRLKNNIKQFLKAGGVELEYTKIIPGRIIVKLSNPSLGQQRLAKKILKKVFGVVNFSLAVGVNQSLADLKTASWELARQRCFSTFRITTLRSQKSFPLTSQQINEEVGAYLLKKSGAQVKLNRPQLNIFIEIVNGRSFIYDKKIAGLGGLPVGVGGRALVLLSGGIDSPVAAFYALKRGVSLNYIHFHSLPFTSPQSIEKVKQLAAVLKHYGGGSNIFMVPFAEVQKEILVKTPEKFRVVLYRRFMARIAEKIAQHNGYLALITGESLGQVASQTLENMGVINQATNLPILRPLVGLDKAEIIDQAQRIGTYPISIQPHDDCCTRFMPKHPATRSNLVEVKQAEKGLAIAKLVNSAYRRVELLTLS